MRADYNTNLMFIRARTEAEIEKVALVVEALIEEGYEDIYEEDDGRVVGLGAPGCTIREMEQDYKFAKQKALGK